MVENFAMTSFQIIPSTTRTRGLEFMAAAVFFYVVLHEFDFHHSFIGDAEGIGALLAIVGTLYSVVYAFATYVIWEQFSSVENEILQESGALKNLILFSRRMRESTREPIVRAVRAYARAVVESEWDLLSRGQDTERTDKLFAAVISSVTDSKPEDNCEHSLYERLLEITNQACTHRDERLALSAKRIPRTLLLFVTVTAWTILLQLFFFPYHNVILGAASIAIATMLLFFAQFVLTDLDNPFEGTWNVNSKPFHDLSTKYH